MKKVKLLAGIGLLLVANISISYQTKATSDPIINQCNGMDTANVHHSIEDQVLTFEWDEIQGDSVNISIFDDERGYIPLGTVNMNEKRFEYNITARGEHRFLLSNGCNDFYYTINFDIHEAYSQELIDATHWAEANGIIPDNPNINSHYLYGSLNNIELANIMNNYAENVLNQTPDTTKTCSFNDFNELTNNQKNIVRKSCQLGLMPGDRNSTSFNPYMRVNRAVFGTVFSRVLWGEQYEGGEPYYSGHLNALKAAGIMNQIDNPEDRVEIKGYVLLMLMRASVSASTLTNNITETVEFPANQTGEKIIFSGSYTAEEDFDVRGFDFTELNKKGFISGDIINFNVYINGEKIQNLGFNMGCNNSCDFRTCNGEYYYGVGASPAILSIKKGDTINIQIGAELDGGYSSDDIYIYNMRREDINLNTISMNLAPIKIINNSNYSDELVDAYNRAYENGLTTESNIEDANMFGGLSNMELARIMVNYAENVLKQTPDTSKTCNFTDIDSVKGELHDYIIESCQLGIMGQESTSFNPYDTVSRATFGTALSRVLWGDENNGGNPYYKKHLEALKAAGIMNQIDNPEDREEIKGYVLLILMRAEQENNNPDCEDPLVKVACATDSDECPAVCKENNITGTNKCDINKDGTVNVTDLTINNNECVNIILGKSTSGTYNCDFNRNGIIDVTDVMAFNDECQKEVTGYSGTGSSSQSSGSSSSSSGKSSGGGGGGGSSVSKTDTTKTSVDTAKTDVLTDKQSDKNENKVENTNQTNTKTQTVANKTTNYNKGNPSEVLSNGYTREMNNAYEFAHDNGITTTNNIGKAKMNSPLTRIAMAKMLSNYAINVLGEEPDTSKKCNFNDVSNELDNKYDKGVTKACQLGIMGENIKNFRPNDEVTRAEFATALSRMLYGTDDGKGNTKYYEPHLAKLNNEGVINNTNPKIKEKRGYVMIMLMRSAE